MSERMTNERIAELRALAQRVADIDKLDLDLGQASNAAMDDLISIFDVEEFVALLDRESAPRLSPTEVEAIEHVFRHLPHGKACAHCQVLREMVKP